jgi:hypothetical protein
MGEVHEAVSSIFGLLNLHINHADEAVATPAAAASGLDGGLFDQVA